jgi:hypothetical protein
MEESTRQPLDAHLLGTVSRVKKEQFLAAMSEDEFRDRVVRPVFERRKLKFVRHTCGSDEEGKDCICIGQDTLSRRIVYAIQTKKGNLNLASKASDNLINAVTQVRTSLETDIHLTEDKQKVRPDVVMLVASGTINNQARRHIHDNVNDPRIDFMDANSLIPLIDEVTLSSGSELMHRSFPTCVV